MNHHAASHLPARILLAFCLISIALGVTLFFPPPPRAHAVGIVVNALGDGNQGILGSPMCETIPGNNTCTLRAAMEQANFFPGSDLITFSVTGTIVLTNTLPIITQDLTIDGPGAGLLTISGANLYRVLHVGGVIFTLSGVTIANGNSGAGGGGIFNSLGTLNIGATSFYSNTSSLGGGAIYNVAGTMDIIGTKFYSNTATGNGGAIYNASGLFYLSNSSVYSNTASSTGGGIYVSSGGLFIVNSAIYSNTASADGGGIYLSSSLLDLTSSNIYSNTAVNANGGGIHNNNGTLLIANSAITNNVAISTTRSNGLGGGIYNYGTMNIGNSTLSNNNAGSAGGAMYVITSTATITNSTFSSNNGGADFGGGIMLGISDMKLDNTMLYGNSAKAAGAISNFGVLTLTNSTVYSNTGTNGAGGILNVGTVTMTNSTIAGNRALTGFGGGIANSALVISGAVFTITNSTIAGNSAITGGGISNDLGVTVTLTNTIVANNTATTGPNCFGSIINGGNNLQFNPNSGCGITIPSGDPKLGPLGNYGGSTKTMPLFLGSAAIDTGNDTACPLTDQRGVLRSGVGAHCDIGAFEGTEYPLYLPLILK